MNCDEVNEMDLVDYLFSLGFQPTKIIREDYWYLSPLRNEKHASFKVNRNKNIWYDHGLGKGGRLVDFAMQYYQCDVAAVLQRFSFFHPQKFSKSIAGRPQFHLQENSLINHTDARETAIKIITAKQPIADPMLCRYLHQRRINKNIADIYCHEVFYNVHSKEKEYRAIGFKNNGGGYELRNPFYKGSSSPKYISYLDNKATDRLTVFEGFFDFLSYHSIHLNQEQALTNFLVLNSLSFFERSLLLMEKHGTIHLYLDNDSAGKKYLQLALNRSSKFKDESKLYSGYKDLNEWTMKLGMLLKQNDFKQSGGRRL